MRLTLVNPLGFRADGRPIWTFSGSEGDDDGGGGSGGSGGDGGDGGGGDDDGDDDDTPDKDGLTSKGRKALGNERTKVKNLTAEVRPVRKLLRDTGLTIEQVIEKVTGTSTGGDNGGGGNGGQNGNGTGQNGGLSQADVDRARQEAQREAQTSAQHEIALARVEARAAQKFADPEDAVMHLRGEVDDLLGRDGKPDVTAIDAALDDLLTRKPHLGKSDEDGPDFEGGSRGGAAGAPKGMDGFIRAAHQRKQGGGRR